MKDAPSISMLELLELVAQCNNQLTKTIEDLNDDEREQFRKHLEDISFHIEQAGDVVSEMILYSYH